jgi:hypothetical protein
LALTWLDYEATHFQFNRHEAIKTALEEERIEPEILIAHLQGDL